MNRRATISCLLLLCAAILPAGVALAGPPRLLFTEAKVRAKTHTPTPAYAVSSDKISAKDKTLKVSMLTTFVIGGLNPSRAGISKSCGGLTGIVRTGVADLDVPSEWQGQIYCGAVNVPVTQTNAKVDMKGKKVRLLVTFSRYGTPLSPWVSTTTYERMFQGPEMTFQVAFASALMPAGQVEAQWRGNVNDTLAKGAPVKLEVQYEGVSQTKLGCTYYAEPVRVTCP